MLKKIAALAVFAAAVGVATANANTISGRVTTFSPTSISVFDKEVVTLGITGDTAFTKLIVQKPWQADTALTADALRVGHYVVVHADNAVATWVQIATDLPLFVQGAFTAVQPRVMTPTYMTEAARHRAEAAALRAAPTASESKRPGSPGTALHCERLAAQLEARRTAAVAPPAAQVQGDNEAARHRAEANARRAAPNASESKRPGSPDTALHCDRIADRLENAGK